MGNVATFTLTDEVNDLPAFKRVMISTIFEKIQGCEHFRQHVYRIGNSDYELGRVSYHFYKIKPLAQDTVPVPACMHDLLNSGKLNLLQKLGLYQSLYPMSILFPPPGTGKTRTLSSIVISSYLAGEGVLCLGKSNVAVRRLCQIIATVVPKEDLGLIVSKEYYKHWHEHLYRERGLKRYLVKNWKRSVLCMTTSMYISYRQREWLTNSRRPGKEVCLYLKKARRYGSRNLGL